MKLRSQAAIFISKSFVLLLQSCYPSNGFIELVAEKTDRFLDVMYLCNMPLHIVKPFDDRPSFLSSTDWNVSSFLSSIFAIVASVFFSSFFTVQRAVKVQLVVKDKKQSRAETNPPSFSPDIRMSPLRPMPGARWDGQWDLNTSPAG